MLSKQAQAYLEKMAKPQVVSPQAALPQAMLSQVALPQGEEYQAENQSVQLTSEQRAFIDCALAGGNILVDACVGSGKTTAIQHLCDEYPNDKRVLYLTYNRLLKVDAKEKIKNKNVTVTNYHGFAFMCLNNSGIQCGISDLIQTFITRKPMIRKYDLMVLDEYQDIDQEISQMLCLVKQANPGMQIVAVGDMKQKIYDKTTLNIESFIDTFLEKHTDMEFTQCFRLSSELAAMLGRVWQKKITGVNKNCRVSYMRKWDIVKFLGSQNPKDVMCLGARTGDMADVLNSLENRYKEKYNKNTVYASITDKNSGTSATEPTKDTAIFTTFDSSKGMERKICVVFDFTEDYWVTRITKPQTKYDILRNIFCVAASRGKGEIIFVRNDKNLLTEKVLSQRVGTATHMENVQISSMFDFKYKEDIEDCFKLLKTKEVKLPDTEPISIVNHDGLIDLSPCIGIYQEAMFFKNYNIDHNLELYKQIARDKNVDITRYKSLDKKILYLVSLETSQHRYIKQVDRNIMEENEKQLLIKRLSGIFTPQEEVQPICEIQFADKSGRYCFSAAGFADVIKNDVVYELKFVSELQHEHFLQCACYVVALGLKKGILWNTQKNQMYEIEVPSRHRFLDAVTKAVTKHQMLVYNAPKKKEKWMQDFTIVKV